MNNKYVWAIGGAVVMAILIKKVPAVDAAASKVAGILPG